MDHLHADDAAASTWKACAAAWCDGGEYLFTTAAAGRAKCARRLFARGLLRGARLAAFAASLKPVRIAAIK